MILSISDFPNIQDFDALESAIRVAEILAQGVDGANRNLSIQEYTETFDLQSILFIPSIHPIVSVSQIQYRGIASSAFDLSYALAEWAIMAPNKYTVDVDAGEITLKSFASVTRIRQPRSRADSPQLKIKYLAGFNFGVVSLEIDLIKSALIELTNQLSLPSTAQGVKSFEVNDEGHKTSYFGANESSIFAIEGKNKINSLLDFFKKYQPRGYSFR